LTGGGSGGHITPLIPLAQELKSQAPAARLVYIGLKKEAIEADERLAIFDELYRVSAGKFRRYHGEGFWAHLLDIRTIWLNLRDVFKLAVGSWQALRLLRRLRPAVVFSKGGYVVVPVGLAARLRRIPLITHDSDVVPGLANRLIGRWAAIHTTGQPAKLYKYPAEATRHVGIPVDERIKPVDAAEQAAAKQQLGLPAKAKVLLIAGGGQGAADINQMVLAIAKQLLVDPQLQIIHITGAAHTSAVDEKYDLRLNPAQRERVRVLGWSDQFHQYAAAADLIITRAGATTLAELALAGKACIVIPSPFLTGGHQLKNAEALTRRGAVEVVANHAPASQLLKAAKGLLASQPRRTQLAAKLAKTAKPKAATQLAALILAVAAGEEAKPT